MNNKRLILGIFISLLFSSFVFFTGFVDKSYPRELYHVYLSGKSLGYIESKEELENYIDREEYEIKNKYGVKNVYAPNDINIVKESTYNEKISTVSEIYNKIKQQSKFTISGYAVTIKGITKKEKSGKEKTTADILIYVLKKKTFTNAFKKTVFNFVSEENYNNFINETQEDIEETGKLIENIYVKNQISIKKERISLNDNIFTDEDLLSKYLLFGTTDTQETYTVKKKDTIEDISLKHKISTNEFLIANPDFTSADNLLYPGQVVTLGKVRPQFELVEEDHVVEKQTSKYKTVIEYDDNIVAGFERVKQNGKNGVNIVTKKIQKVNGEIENAVVISSKEEKPTINKIIVRGSGSQSYGKKGTWGWPTNTPYIITSGFGYRWGSFHDAVDIAGTGYGSPIYAANDGTVVTASYTNINGNYIIINHNNGYYTYYGHLSKRLVSAGQNVSIGQQIGKMGQTGWATGTHLHFSIYRGMPFRGGTALNPLGFY